MLSAIPNLITGLRFILVIPISVYIYQGNDLFALVLFIIAGLSDGLDGYLARRYDWSSEFGKFADPLADKCLIIATLIASIIFLIIDVIWLSFATKSFYRPLIGNLLADKPVMWAAALFYILYVFGMSLIVIQPCIDSDSIFKTIYTGFVFGLVAYGTYNLTNMAVLNGWSPTVTFVDMFWGGTLTAVSATTGLYIAKKIVHLI